MLLISGARAKSVGNQELIAPNVRHAGWDLEREIILLLFILKHYRNKKTSDIKSLQPMHESAKPMQDMKMYLQFVKADIGIVCDLHL